MTKCVLLVINLVLCISIKSEAARILAVFPTPSISHQVVFRPITQELAKRGHEVIVITPDPAFPKGQGPANLTEIDVHDISYSEWEKGFMTSTSKGSKSDLITQLKVILETLSYVFDKQLQTKQVRAIMNDKSQQFDLLIVEACVRSALAFSHLYKVPMIAVSSFGRMYGNYEALGAPTHPLLYPTTIRQKLNNLTVWDKVYELYNHFAIIRTFDETEVYENRIIKKNFGADTPSYNELNNNIDLLLLNMHPILEGKIPVPPNVIHIWGVHQKPEKELPTDLKSYLDSCKRGIIYISFGTNVNPSLLPQERINVFIKAFSQLPYDVLWKWDKDLLPGISNNVKIGKWFPQSDMLRHPNIKLFITQGGLQSTDEAITAGVPLIGVPMLGDQWFNVERYITLQIGVRLDLESMTEGALKGAVNKVINDESYRRNIIKLRTLMSDRPQPALESAVWWTEYVLRHGGAKHLRSPAANMSWSEYLELELLLSLVLGFFSLVALLGLTIYFVVIYYASNNKIKDN